METVHKPIRRSKELVPLSQEHHEGLLVVWKIKQGLQNGTEHAIIADFIRWCWQTMLEDHFRKEEQWLVRFLPADNVLVKQMLEEHQEIEALVHVSSMIADEDIFRQLADLLNKHIRFEERTLFPFAEQHISPHDLQLIYEQLTVPPVKKSGWENEFWARK